VFLGHHTRRRSTGFSLVELSVALTIACVLLALGAPSVSGYLQNARLGSMAQSFYGGLQTARTEAVKQNTGVELVMTNSSLETTTPDAVVPDPTGRNWMVRLSSVPASGIEWKATNANDQGGVAIAASGALFAFDALGQASGPVGGIAFTNPALGACSPNGPVRCWNVIISTGGQVRLCSPDPALNSRDSRAC
jgi:type IV fimbrial biogenesis protein FimT